MEELAEPADGPAECSEVARGGCVFAWSFSVTRSAELTVAERRPRPNMASLHKWLAPSLPAKNHCGAL